MNDRFIESRFKNILFLKTGSVHCTEQGLCFRAIRAKKSPSGG